MAQLFSLGGSRYEDIHVAFHFCVYAGLSGLLGFVLLLVVSTFPGLGRVLPAITRLTLYPNTWILICPLPWVIYAAVLSRRTELTRGAAVIFAITVVAATVLLVAVVVTACFLPLRAMT